MKHAVPVACPQYIGIGPHTEPQEPSRLHVSDDYTQTLWPTF